MPSICTRQARHVWGLRDAITRDGLIGDLLEMCAYGKQDQRAGGEDLMVLGSHLMDLLSMFAGTPLWCSARVLAGGRDITRADARQVKDNVGPVAGDEVFAQFAFPGGVNATSTSAARLRETVGSWSATQFWNRKSATLAIDRGVLQAARMNWSELFQPAFRNPMQWSGGAALLLFLMAWWREREAGSALPLGLLGLAWVVCHVKVNALSYIVPPRDAVDWLVPGASVLLLAGVGAWLMPRRRISVMGLSALLITVAACLALRQLPWLMERGESAGQRLLWTGAGIAAVLAAFVSAEWTARRVSPAALLMGMAVIALLAALGLWRMASPERMVARPLAVAAMAAGAAAAAGLRRGTAILTPGMAGWMSGGILVLFFCGCLSRVSAVPVGPLAAAVAGVPASALLVWLHRRSFLSGTGLAWLAGALLTGTAIFWFCAADQRQLEATPLSVETTGADDTGAYD